MLSHAITWIFELYKIMLFRILGTFCWSPLKLQGKCFFSLYCFFDFNLLCKK